MASVFDILKERGFLAQLTHEEEIQHLLASNKVTLYAGFDPTSDSLHVGHLLPIMAMAHFQHHGHLPIALVGGGTAMIGDPTGKEEMRQMLTPESIDININALQQQLSHFIDFSENHAKMVNNGDWIRSLNFVEFLREIGPHFSVNRMLTAECFKLRLERGLSFIEFNYMLLQAYDFLLLNKKYGCQLQIGGDDQWSNILAGIDLIRRKERKEAYGLTLTLITTASGKKMGKTEKGAVWLSSTKTSPYDYYQFWRNTDDKDVKRFLSLFTFLPMEEIEALAALSGQDINTAKKALAFEATAIVHGKEAAAKAAETTTALFETGGNTANAPTTEIRLSESLAVLDLFLAAGLITSKSEGRKLIGQKGLSLNDETLSGWDMKITRELADKEGFLLLRKGKKLFHRIKLM
ncbi:MAG: tyrosine--tRNA ligase [Elusimicrobia bacterium RIFOXYB2_FULL_49_7]|nr:MAG: tyrosine--tRNA ligase [Elusimicrobia bacterium RIFOXYB2_FULL_49_7]